MDEHPAASGLPGLDKAVARTRTPLVGAKLPGADVAKGALVLGYPKALAPPLGSVVVSSSVAPSTNGALQVALVARDDRGADTVLSTFRSRMSGLGAHEVPTTTVAGTQAAAFRRGMSSVVVSATAGRRTSYTVFATVYAKD